MKYPRFSAILKQNCNGLWTMVSNIENHKTRVKTRVFMGNPKKPETRVFQRTGLNNNPNSENKCNSIGIGAS